MVCRMWSMLQHLMYFVGITIRLVEIVAVMLHAICQSAQFAKCSVHFRNRARAVCKFLA